MRNAPRGAKALTLENVMGAFLVLILGICLASLTAATEFLWSARKILANQNVSPFCTLQSDCLCCCSRTRWDS